MRSLLGQQVLLLLVTVTGWSQAVPNPDVLWLAHERADAINCLNRLKQIGIAARLWQSDNGGVWPSGFSVLTNELGTPLPLFCPSHYRGKGTPADWENFDWDAIDYKWIAPANPADPAAIFCECRVHRNVGRVEGSASLLPGFQPGWPRFLAPPLSQIASTGSPVRFEFVLANAAANTHFQWNREEPFWRTNVNFVVIDHDTGDGYWQTNFIGTNAPIPGATNATFEIASVATNDGGYYSVTASNALGAAKTPLYRLSVLMPPAPTPTAELLCQNRLRSINLAARLWAQDHAENLPLRLGEMTNDIGYPLFGWPLLLYCPADTNRVAPSTWPAVNFTNTSYEILQTNAAALDLPEEPFARCRVHGFVVLGDGTIRPALTFNFISVGSANRQLSWAVQNLATRSFVIQASTNLLNWTDMMTITNPSAAVSFTDSMTNHQRRFYRAVLAE